MTGPTATVLPGGHSEWEPPDLFSNSEVKTLCADASVDFVDVKVGHCQALNSMKTKPSPVKAGEGFFTNRVRRCDIRHPIARDSFTQQPTHGRQQVVPIEGLGQDFVSPGLDGRGPR